MTYALSKHTSNYPILSEHEEFELAKDYKITGNLEAAHKLAMSHLQLVFKVANRYIGYGLPKDDLAQEGFIGLLLAIKKYDYDKGVRLAAFAVYDIKYKIGEYIIKNYRQVRIATTKAALRLFWNREVVNSDLDTLETLNVTQKQLNDFEARYAGKETSIDIDDSVLALPSPYKTPYEHLEDRDTQRQAEALRNALNTLDARTKDIIESRYLAESPVTLQELGNKFGISYERVRQIEIQGLKILRNMLTNQ